MPGIFVGPNEIVNMGNNVQEVYVGPTKVWPTAVDPTDEYLAELQTGGNLLFFLPMQESALPFVDISGNGKNTTGSSGVINFNGPPITPMGTRSIRISAGAYLTIAAPVATNNVAYAWTISAWIRGGAEGGPQAEIGFRAPTYNYLGFRGYILNSGQSLGAYITTAGSQNVQCFGTAGLSPKATGAFICWRFKNATECDVYYNGQLLQTVTPLSGSAVTTNPTQVEVRIGSVSGNEFYISHLSINQGGYGAAKISTLYGIGGPAIP